MRKLPEVHVPLDVVLDTPRRHAAAEWLGSRMAALGLRPCGFRLPLAELYVQTKRARRSLADALCVGLRRPWPADAPSIDVVEDHIRAELVQRRLDRRWSTAEAARRLLMPLERFEATEASVHVDVVTLVWMCQLYEADPALCLPSVFLAMPDVDAVRREQALSGLDRGSPGKQAQDGGRDEGTSRLRPRYNGPAAPYWWAKGKPGGSAARSARAKHAAQRKWAFEKGLVTPVDKPK